MPVRFKGRSEYQKSFRVSRSRSASPQRRAPLAGLRSDQMGISREPGLQRRRRPGPGGPARSCSSLLFPADPQPTAERTAPPAERTAPPAASRSRSAQRREASLEPNPPTPPGPPSGPGPALKPAKPRPSKHDSQSQPSRPVTAAAAADGQQPSANEVEQHALRWRAGLRAGGQRSGGQRSEYHRQFGWKKPATAASPLLNAEQVFRSSSRSVPPFKKHPVPMETEYRRSFLGLVPPPEPRLRKHLEHHQRAPLFHTHTQTNKKRREESEKKPRPNRDDHTPLADDSTPSPPQVRRGRRMWTEYESSFRSPLCRIEEEGGGATDGDAALQAKALRQQASSYRRRAWGANFSRDHLSQLLSEHNALWEATDTTDSATDPPTTPPRLTFDLCGRPDSRSTPPVEPLDLTSRSGSSRKSSSAADSHNQNTKTPPSPAPAAERRTSAWGEEEEEEDTDEEEEGRLPTPRLKIRPVQRTHHDLTTPATGGAILVGKLKNSDEPSPHRQIVSMATRTEAAGKRKEAWSGNSPASSDNKPATGPASKPIRTSPPVPVAPPPLAPPPHHCIHGTLRHADFQHNGDLGRRLRGSGSDEDDRLSVMSWRSAASCSAASALLERAQRRRDDLLLSPWKPAWRPHS